MNENCNNCGSTEWEEYYEDRYGGAKSRDGRNETVCTIFQCEECESEGRRFEDGVDGTVTLTGALR